jgi:hypothetical protein
MRLLLAIALVLSMVSFTNAQTLRERFEEITSELTAILSEHDDKVEIEISSKSFVAKLDTRTYVVHKRRKGGYLDDTRNEEGPDSQGFIIDIRISPVSNSQWPANLKIHRPYWEEYLWIGPHSSEEVLNGRLSYGLGIDEKLKEDVIRILKGAT